GDKAWFGPSAQAITTGIEGGPSSPGFLQAWRRGRQLGGTDLRQTLTIRICRVQDFGSGEGLGEQQAFEAQSFCGWRVRRADRDMSGSDAVQDEAFRFAGGLQPVHHLSAVYDPTG